jgi:SAM-dependent methyltransferase
MAMSIIDYLGIKRGQFVLDFGCAKGYLVRALRMLGRLAYGYDISEYALSQTGDMNIFCKDNFGPCPTYFDFCIAKDVFEHISESELSVQLKALRKTSSVIFAIIPLGSAGEYHAKKNNLDISHVICQDEVWWIKFFKQNGLISEDVVFQVPGIKESYPVLTNRGYCHGFFTLKSDQ